MLKIFLTGDNQIGMQYASHREAAQTGMPAEAFAELVQAANAEGCDLFVLAGDLFENRFGGTGKTIRGLMETLSSFRGTVAVLPGDRDETAGDAKLRQCFRELLPEFDNILLLDECRPYPLHFDGVDAVLYPALLSASGENGLGWIRALHIPRDGACHIGIARAATEWETADRGEGACVPVRREELEALPIDLWLIGHARVPLTHGLTTEAAATEERIFGTPVRIGANGDTEGACLILELGQDETVRAKKAVIGDPCG